MAHISTETRGELLVVYLVGNVGGTAIRPLRSALEGAFTDRVHQVVVDMSGVTRCDPPVWAVLVAASRRLGWAGGRLQLVGVTEAVLRALRSTGLHRLVSVASPAHSPVSSNGAA